MITKTIYFPLSKQRQKWCKMKNKSLKRNFFYNTALSILNLLFPLITFPYASRVLAVSGIGLVAFATAFVSYFTMVSNLGTPDYGVREIARVRDSKRTASQLFVEIQTINLIATIFCAVAYYVMIFTLPYFRSERLLYIIMGFSIILNVFSVDWLFQGFEDYGFLTLRNIIIKLVSILLLFIFVRQRSDYVMYGALSVIALSGTNIFNLLFLRKYVSLRSITKLKLTGHVRPLLILFFSVCAVTVYTSLDSVILGLMGGTVAVGYYTAAYKVVRLVVCVIAAMGSALLPRLSYYAVQKSHVEFDALVEKSIRVILWISLPSLAGILVLAPLIIQVLSGAGFMPSVLTLRILAFTLPAVGMSICFNTQILIPTRNEAKFMIAVFAGAVIDILFNILLIPYLSQNGTAIANLLTEVVIMLVQLYFVRNRIQGKLFNRNNVKYFIGSISVGAVTLAVRLFDLPLFPCVIISTLLGAFIYIVALFLMKESITYEILGSMYRKLKSNKS